MKFRVRRRQLLHLFVAASSAFSRLASSSVGPDDDDVSWRRLVEPLGAQNDVSAWSPRHVLQAQRQIAGHRIAHNDVLAAGIRQQLQHRATSMSWKLSVRRSPVYSFFSSAAARLSDGLISMVYWLSD